MVVEDDLVRRIRLGGGLRTVTSALAASAVNSLRGGDQQLT